MGDMSDNTGNEGREVPSTYLVSQQVSSQSVQVLYSTYCMEYSTVLCRVLSQIGANMMMM